MIAHTILSPAPSFPLTEETRNFDLVADLLYWRMNMEWARLGWIGYDNNFPRE